MRLLHCVRYVALAAALAASVPGCPEFQSGPVAYGAPASRFVTVNGRRLHVVDEGDPAKPTIVFLHGFASSSVV